MIVLWRYLNLYWSYFRSNNHVTHIWSYGGVVVLLLYFCMWLITIMFFVTLLVTVWNHELLFLTCIMKGECYLKSYSSQFPFRCLMLANVEYQWFVFCCSTKNALHVKVICFLCRSIYSYWILDCSNFLAKIHFATLCFQQHWCVDVV